MWVSERLNSSFYAQCLPQYLTQSRHWVHVCSINRPRKNESHGVTSGFRDTVTKSKSDQFRRKLENGCNFIKIQLNVVIVRCCFLNFFIFVLAVVEGLIKLSSDSLRKRKALNLNCLNFLFSHHTFTELVYNCTKFFLFHLSQGRCANPLYPVACFQLSSRVILFKHKLDNVIPIFTTF